LIQDRFLLETETAARLFESYAAAQPIFDYHCHLPVKEIAQNRRFKNLFEIWLEGDHYKWRAMRANGEPERYCTGDATPYEKFAAWARTVPYTLRNPLYHWTHLELERYFGITLTLNAESAKQVWHEANAVLESGELDVHRILEKFNVHTICTTDDPADSLEHHEAIADSGLKTRVLPTFRPDAALRVDSAGAFSAWVGKLERASGIAIDSFGDFLRALKKRHEDFHAIGCRLSDHGLDICYSAECTETQAREIFDQARQGNQISPEELRLYASFLMRYFGELNGAAGWTMQLHLGALRNVNSRAKAMHGPDTGFDAMGGTSQVHALAVFLDRLEQDSSLPRTIIYNSNPVENYAFATLIGSFSAEGVPGKVQFGSGWWFLDQKEGIEWQLNALSNVGLLSRFVGMVTDSRSFLSYPRHEYFRRVLCNLLGGEMERGLLPQDEELVGGMVRDICFGNAVRYFGLPPAGVRSGVSGVSGVSKEHVMSGAREFGRDDG
jgi:glucuronate isomerase